MTALERYRAELDAIDDALLPLFLRRMEIAERIGEYKRENGLPVYDAQREEEILRRLAGKCPEEMREDAAALYALLFARSRLRQEQRGAECGVHAIRNIVLIGMPGCGKSTLGGLLSQALDRPLWEADDLVERQAGRTIPEIFEQEGEEGFRRRETLVLSELGKLSGAVIATGGGCVTREENYDLLKRNGVLIWLQRDCARLAREGRPISLHCDPEELYAVRRPLYERFADRTIDNNGSLEDTLAAILEAVQGKIL